MHKRVVWSLLITNDLLLDIVIVLWRINFKSIPWMREHFCRPSCYPCLVAKHDQSSGEGGCTVRTLVLFQLSWKSKHLRSSKSISRPLIHFFMSLATLRQDKETPAFKALSSSAPDELQLLVILLLMRRFWWTCFWWRHHFRSTFLQTLQASFLLILLLSFVLSEPLKDMKFCLWSCTLEQILAYPIGNF